MTKYFLFLFISFALVADLFSQESNIVTRFSKAGILFSDINKAQALTEFKKNHKCIVLDYLGDDIYKVNYKKQEGFVGTQNLLVSDDMIDLVILFENRKG